MDKSSCLELARVAKKLKYVQSELATVKEENAKLQKRLEEKCNEYDVLQNDVNDIGRQHYMQGQSDMKRSTTHTINRHKTQAMEWEKKFMECNGELLIAKNKLIDFARLDGSIDLCNNQLESQITRVSGILKRKCV